MRPRLRPSECCRGRLRRLILLAHARLRRIAAALALALPVSPAMAKTKSAKEPRAGQFCSKAAVGSTAQDSKGTTPPRVGGLSLLRSSAAARLPLAGGHAPGAAPAASLCLDTADGTPIRAFLAGTPLTWRNAAARGSWGIRAPKQNSTQTGGRAPVRYSL